MSVGASERVQRHRETLVRLLAKQYTLDECARALGLSRRRIGQLLEEFPDTRERARQLADSSDPTTTDVLRRLMLTSRDEKVQLAAAVALRRDPPPAAQLDLNRTIELVISRDDETGEETYHIEPPAGERMAQGGKGGLEEGTAPSAVPSGTTEPPADYAPYITDVDEP